MLVKEYIEALYSLGYELVYLRSFYPVHTSQEKHFVLWHDEDGILINGDTAEGHVHECLAYYNLKVVDSKHLYHNPRSISMVQDGVVYGYFGVQEGILTKINSMKRCGNFLNPWKFVPRDFAIINYLDLDGRGTQEMLQNAKKVTDERMKVIKEEYSHVYSAVYNVEVGDSSDMCKKCGGYGEVRLTACVCKQCGNTIWGC